jgi:Fe-S-cluster containining protein
VSTLASPACLGCGACCFGPGRRYVRVSGDDHARLGDAAERLSVFIENRCYMRMHDGHCAALSIQADGSFFCTVYAERPSVCRELASGSAECQAELVQKHAARRRALLPLWIPR